ncbi:peptidoglycan/LPS O-acetylase OafA/YrhL [Catalinimonas alkaloidigena]|uniref:acyltransferase family protein n=1 Tax=Catalinimonas alkaloidigena TaxID=1075417 RepID=UPI002406D122|nr:acyltransferase [Catalinimonas alkaloidigena]MDF9798343.1 peptidoglycan/LPS O-acetylase OafA/YrhL [Catalinimonas alkaloidigena]
MKLEKLEAIRGFAALYVVLHHILPKNLSLWDMNISFLFRFGQEAVILFFLLSGFVIHYSFENSKNKSFFSYIIKRGLRVYIPLVIVYLISYFIESFNTSRWVEVSIFNVVGNLFMLQDLEFLRPNTICPPLFGNTPLWSLSYEWWFYMLYFLIQKKTNYLNQNKFVFAMFTVATLSYLIYPFFLNRVLMYFGIWWGGVMLAKSYLVNDKVKIADLKYYLSYSFLAILILLVNVYIRTGFVNIQAGAYPFGEVRHFVFSLIIIIAAIVWQKKKWIGFDHTFSPFIHFAKISYVIYILHHPLMYILAEVNSILNPIIGYCLFFFFLCAVSYVIEILLYPLIKNKVLSLIYSKAFKRNVLVN